MEEDLPTRRGSSSSWEKSDRVSLGIATYSTEAVTTKPECADKQHQVDASIAIPVLPGSLAEDTSSQCG